jgi:hypothetical protein
MACYDNSPMKIRTIDEENIPLLVSGYRLKIYNKPLSKEEFTSTIKSQVSSTKVINRTGNMPMKNL